MRTWLRNLRKAKGFTMKTLGEMVGVSESYYCAIENGSRKGKMDLTLVANLSDALEIPMETVIEYELAEKVGS